MTIKIEEIEPGVLLIIKTIVKLSTEVNIRIHNRNSTQGQSKLVKVSDKPFKTSQNSRSGIFLHYHKPAT